MDASRQFTTVNGEVHTIPHGVNSAEYLDGWGLFCDGGNRPDDRPDAARGWNDALHVVFDGIDSKRGK